MSRPPLVLVPQHFGSLVFDRRSSRYYPFDPAATRALRTPRADALRAAAPAERAALVDFYERFADLGFFTLDGRFAGEVREPPPEGLPDHLQGPLATHLEVVAACNLTCTHCFAGALPRGGRPLDLGELDVLFAELARLGSFRLGLTGGEPLLRKDLLEVLDLALGHGLHPCLTTNGLLLTERLARELGRRELVWLNVSLEGATAASNDRVRGAGTFARVRERLRLLAGVARFTLAFTITSQNAHEVEDCARLARDVGAHTAVFRPLYPAGVALERLELLPSFAQYHTALARLTRLEAAGGFEACGLDPFSPQARAERRPRLVSHHGCGAGDLVCSISVEGRVSPCSFLGAAFEEEVSLRERPFGALWREGQRFRALRHAEGEAFRGGCRARAQALGGSAHAPDPWHAEWLRAGGAGPDPLANLELLGPGARRLPLVRG